MIVQPGISLMKNWGLQLAEISAYLCSSTSNIPAFLMSAAFTSSLSVPETDLKISKYPRRALETLYLVHLHVGSLLPPLTSFHQLLLLRRFLSDLLEPNLRKLYRLSSDFLQTLSLTSLYVSLCLASHRWDQSLGIIQFNLEADTANVCTVDECTIDLSVFCPHL